MARDIEFIDSAPDEPAHELLDVRPRRPRPWWTGLVVLAAALVAVTFALTHNSPSHSPGAAPTRPVPSSSSSDAGVGVPDHALGTPAADTGDNPCGAAPECAVSFIVPGDLSSALHAHLAHLAGLRVQSSLAQSLSTGGVYLADRVIYVRDPVAPMRITVHRLTGAVPAPEAIAFGVARVRLITPAFVVDVLSYPTASGVLPTSVLRALAHDPRLEVV